MFRSLVKSVDILRPNLRSFSAITDPFVHAPSLVEKFPNKFVPSREVWIENFNTVNEQKLDIMKVHPDVFAVSPRIDLIHQNVIWQRKYHFVSFAHSKSRAEVAGGGRKPWPQKGQGRARHGSIRSPLFRGGGRAHGPRSPTSHFYMLPFYSRVHGLTSTLSVKLAQDDLHVIADLEIPTEDPEYIKSMIEERKWGPSVLIVGKEDIIPENLALATDALKYVNVMPAYGLNVYSMLKYDTLVMTKDAIEHVQEKILFHLHRNETKSLLGKFKPDQH